MKNNLLVVITMILHFFNQLISIPRNQTSQKLQKICFFDFLQNFRQVLILTSIRSSGIGSSSLWGASIGSSGIRDSGIAIVSKVRVGVVRSSAIGTVGVVETLVVVGVAKSVEAVVAAEVVVVGVDVSGAGGQGDDVLLGGVVRLNRKQGKGMFECNSQFALVLDSAV